MTISNRVSIALVFGFFAVAWAADMPLGEIGWHVSASLSVLALTFAFFMMGWIGGGDAKLAAATALWLGWAQLPDYGVISGLIGGVLTLLILQLRRWPMPSWLLAPTFMARLAERGGGVPYGIALALAGLILYPESGLWLTVAAR